MPWYVYALLLASTVVTGFAMARGSWQHGKISLGLIVIALAAAIVSVLA